MVVMVVVVEGGSRSGSRVGEATGAVARAPSHPALQSALGSPFIRMCVTELTVKVRSRAKPLELL